MRTITAIERVTLEGVIQAPGDPDEDRREGFTKGGWANAYNDDVVGTEMSKGMGQTDLLLGGRTYDILEAAWADKPEPNPFSNVLRDTRKYVASRTPGRSLRWANSTLLEGEAIDTVASVKQQPGRNLTIIGSGELLRSLLRAGLVDRLTLLVHPLVLGVGRRLFDDGSPPSELRLTDCVTSPTGVVIASYRPA